MKKKSILIADDDGDLLAILATRCQNLGCEVIRSSDGLEAELELLLKNDNEEFPDLVILDIEMPFDSGLSICEELKRDEILSRIPVIILTGRRDATTIRHCHDLGAIYVHKSPGMWSTLEPLIADLLEMPCNTVPQVSTL